MKKQTATEHLVEIFDPAMCCSTGVCGPDVDDRLVQFARDLKWLKSLGVEVIRYNLGQEPEKFKVQAEVIGRLKSAGSDILPIVVINGRIVSEGDYPGRDRLSEWLQLTSPQNNDMKTEHSDNGTSSKPSNDSPSHLSDDTDSAFIYDQRTDILVAIGAALAAGCASSLRDGFSRGRELGITEQDMARAMQTALNVRQVPMHQILDVANQLLGVHETGGCAPGGGCC